MLLDLKIQTGNQALECLGLPLALPHLHALLQTLLLGRLAPDRFDDVDDLQVKDALVREGAMKALHPGLVLPDHCLQNPEKLLGVPHLLQIDPIFLPGEVPLLNPDCVLIEGPELLLRDLAILLVLEALVCGEGVVGVEEGVADLVDDVLAGEVEGVGQLRLYLVEVVVDRLLEQPALRLYRALHRELAHQPQDLLLGQVQDTAEVVVVPPQALLAPAALLRLAVLGSAEKCNALPVFAFVHFSDSIYNHPP